MEKTFAELYCIHRRLPRQQYRDAMLGECLYPRTLMFRRLLVLSSRDYFKADYDLISEVGLLTKPETLDAEIHDFLNRPANHRFLRRFLRFRVSTRRLKLIFNTLMRRTASPARNGAG